MTALALPELDVARAQRWCATRVPEHARHQVRVECQVAARHLTIVERRAPWRENVGPEWTSSPIARLHYTAADKLMDPLLARPQPRFHIYDPLAPTNRIDDLLSEIDRDPPASPGDNRDRPKLTPSFRTELIICFYHVIAADTPRQPT